MKFLKFTTIRIPKLTWMIVLVFTCCVEPYNPPILSGDIDILVVDGFLNATDSSATVQLSKATALSYSGGPVPELSAYVRIEDENGALYPLIETGGGIYAIQKMNLNPALKYRLSIRTANDNEYASDFVEILQTPPIDSITYRSSTQTEGLSIYINTHDPSANTKYYQWTFVETWEYTAGHYSMYKIKDGKVVEQDEAIYQCWNTKPSTEIHIASTTQLSQDAVRNFELMVIPRGSQKLSRKYSLELQQHALTKEAYDFWLQLKKTTESLGGLFDPLPSQVLGNMRNTTDQSKPVLGYFSGGYVNKQRIFIRFIDLPEDLRHIPRPLCPVDTILAMDVPLYPDVNIIGPHGYPTPSKYLHSPYTNCMDCRDAGGQTKMPEFWE